jgi:hypothetical protein
MLPILKVQFKKNTHTKFSFNSQPFVTKALLIVFVLSAMQSCINLNATKKQEVTVCNKQDEKMKMGIVRTYYNRIGYPCFSHEYPNAKMKHCTSCVIPMWPMRRFALKHYCKSCTNEMRKDRREKRK